MATRAVRGVLKVALVLCVAAAFWNGACSPDVSKPLATLSIAPASVTFNDTLGKASTGSRAVTITAEGSEAVSGLSVTVSYPSGAPHWLTATLSDTLTPATLTLSSNMAGLAPNTYQATVSIVGKNADSAAVPVTLQIAPAVPPVMVLSAQTVTFSDTTGSANQRPQTVTIKRADTASADLTGLHIGTITYVGTPGWVTATLSDTSAPATLTVTEDKSHLPTGTFTATVPISSNATNSPQALTVHLSIIDRPPPPPPPGPTVTIVATANMGKCGSDLGKQTAQVIKDANPDYVFMLGTSAMPESGRVTTLSDYINCYDPILGTLKNKTYAAVGDHEVDIDSTRADFGTGLASGLDAYFGPTRVGPPGQNWYSFDLASWHIIALNVQTPGGYTRPAQIAYHAGSDQLNWLWDDLQAHTNKCTLAFWYESMWFSSNLKPGDPGYPKDGYRIQDVRGVWTVLYQNGADLVINGWPRIYERFAPMYYANGYTDPTPSEWAADSVHGIRQITVGLGGDGPITADSATDRLPTSEYRSGGNGALKLVLGNGSYTWQFLNTKYSHIQDSGTGTCHGAP